MQITTIGLDIDKNVFQVRGIDAGEKVVVRRQLRRSQMLAFFEVLPPCLVGMEACASSHCWARELRNLGHQFAGYVRTGHVEIAARQEPQIGEGRSERFYTDATPPSDLACPVFAL